MFSIALWVLGGCAIVPFETPSAYDQQVFLCPSEEALAERVLVCSDDAACKGIFSFQGEIQGVELTVDSPLTHSLVRIAQIGATERVLSTIDVSGSAPYFHYDLALASIGTPWPEGGGATDWEVVFGAPLAGNATDFSDGVGSIEWTIIAGTDTATLQGLPGEGSIDVSYVSEDRIDLTFDGTIGVGSDALSACLVIFPERLEIVPLP